MATEKKYVSLSKLGLYDEKIKKVITDGDAATLAEAKSFASGLASNYEPSGAAATAAAGVQAKLDEEVARAKLAEEANAASAKKAQDEVDALELVVDTKAAAADLAALAGKVGEVPADQTVMGIIENIQENAYDDTAIRGLISGLDTNKADKIQVATDIENAVKVETEARAQAIAGVQGAVDGLAGTHATDKKALEDAIALKADKAAFEEASETLAAVKKDVDDFFLNALGDTDTEQVKNTLRELQDYIASDESGAATMAGNIQTNANDIDALEGRMNTAEGKITTAEGKVSTLEGEMDGVQAAVATKVEQEVYNTKIAALEGADSALAGRLDVIEGQLGESGSVAEDIEEAKQAAITEAVAQAAAKDTALETSLKKYADDEDAKIELRVDALETASATHALASDLTALDGRVTTAEGKIGTLEGKMTAVETKAANNETAIGTINTELAKKAAQADLESAIARIAANEEGLASFVEVSEAEILSMFQA